MEQINKLIEKHKQQAMEIANFPEYNEVNMLRHIENPVIRSLVIAHIDFIRELSNLMKKEHETH